MNPLTPRRLLVASLALFVSCGSADNGSGDSGETPKAGAAATSMDIVETAVAAGSFETLATALTAADLIETLKGEGPFTVFAPNDAAFAKVPGDALDALLANKAQLTKVLTYHVVPGKLMASDVVGMPSITTVQGQSATISVDAGTAKIDGATIVKTDIECSNGVIHVIDTVIMPQ